MSTYSYSDSFLFEVAGVLQPINGATVTAFKASRFGGSPPAANTTPPASPDAGPVITGPTFGSDGAFTIALPTAEPYYVCISYAGGFSWKLVNADQFKDGTSGATAEVDPGVIGGPTSLSASTTATTQSAGDNSTKIATTAYADRMLPLAGGSMTGPAILSGDPTASLGAVTKQYADMADILTRIKPSDYVKTYQVNQGATLAVSMNGLSLPQGGITVNAAPSGASGLTGFPQSGSVIVASSNGPQVVAYTGLSGNSLTGCTGGTGTLSTNGLVQIVGITTTVAAGSNGASLPQGTINVASTVGAPQSGTFAIATGGNPATITYTGKTNTTFTGCTGGTGTLSTGGAVTVPVTASFAAANAQITVDRTRGKGFWPGPQFRVLVMVDPGTYSESVAPAGFIDVVGSTGNPADVTFTQTGGSANSPTLNMSFSNYVANITFAVTGTGAGHEAGALTTFTTNNPFRTTQLFVNCVFTSSNPNQYAVFTSGSDGCFTGFFFCNFNHSNGSGGFYACEFESAPSPRFAPSTTLCYSCTVTGSAGAPAHFFGDGHGVADQFIWINGPTGSTASLTCIAAASPAFPFFYVDPAVATVTSSAIVGTQIKRTVMNPAPLPVGGMTNAERNCYYPDKLNMTATTPMKTPDTTTSALTANRLYYIPFPVKEAVNLLSILAFVSSGFTGNIWAAIYQDDGTGKPKTYLNDWGQAVVNGINTLTMNNPANSGTTVYPYYNLIWLAVVDTSGTPVYDVSAFFSTFNQCYYQDLTPGFGALPNTATPVALPVGTNVPIVGYTTV